MSKKLHITLTAEYDPTVDDESELFSGITEELESMFLPPKRRMTSLSISEEEDGSE